MSTKRERREGNIEMLRCRFTSVALTSPHSAETWLRVWYVFATDPWFNAQLDRCARSLVGRYGVPVDWVEDVKQETMLIFAEHLQKNPDMNFNRNRARGARFARWLRTILSRDCRQAWRRLQRFLGDRLLFDDLVPSHSSSTRRDVELDVKMILKHVEEPDATVLQLWSKGSTVADIAQEMELQTWQVRYSLRRGLARMKFALSKGYGSG